MLSSRNPSFYNNDVTLTYFTTNFIEHLLTLHLWKI